MDKFSIDKDNFVEAKVVNGKTVLVGLDDYGQCYYFEFVDDKGEIRSIGCGTYNENYEDEIKGYFETDTQRLYRLWREQRDFIKDLVNEIDELKAKLGGDGESEDLGKGS